MVYDWEFKFDSDGIVPDSDLVLSDIGMIRKNDEATHHMRAYPFRPLDRSVGECLDMMWCEEGLNQTLKSIMSALGVPVDIFKIS